MEGGASNLTTGARPRRGLRVWFAVVVAVALAIRLVYLAQLSDSPLFAHPDMDPGVHHAWAQRVAAGEEWALDERTGHPIPYFRAPLYIWFLGGIYQVFGVDPGFPPRVIQSLLGALSCGLVLLIAAQAFDRRVGITAGLAAALCWTLVYFDNELLIVPLAVFLDLLLLYLLLLAADRRSWALFAAAGLACGLCAIARPNILLFAPAVCVWILVLFRRAGAPLKAGAAAAGLFAVGLLVPVLPVTLRNAMVGGDLVLISSQGGVNFYIGNNPDTDGVTAVVPGTPPDWWGGYRATRAMAEQELGRAAKPSEVSRVFARQAFAFWRDEPLAALAITAGKTRLFFCRQEFANNQCLYTFTRELTPITAWLPVGFGLAAPLGLLGLLVLGARPRRLRLFPLWGFAAIYTLSVVAFFVTARYRMPVVPVFIVTGAFAFWWLVEKARGGQAGRLAAGLAGLALFAGIVLHVPGIGFGRVYTNEAEAFLMMGRASLRAGEIDRARDYLDRAAAASRRIVQSGLSPVERQAAGRSLAGSLFETARIHEDRGRLDAALAAYGEALQQSELPPPEALLLHESIARVLARLGRSEEAAAHDLMAKHIRNSLLP